MRTIGTPSVWLSVQPKPDRDPPHPRAGQAGVIWGTNPDKPAEMSVKWDADGHVTVETVADFNALA